MADKYYEGVGRRKTSTARVRIYKGKKANVVNDRPLEEYFTSKQDVTEVLMPLTISDLEGQYYLSAHVNGGGTTGQKGAVQLGLARALVKMDEMLKPDLRKGGMMTRDPRMVERKKYSRRKARKKPQFSKR